MTSAAERTMMPAMDLYSAIMGGVQRMSTVTPLYRAVLVELERRRQQLGWPAWKLEYISGVQDGYSQKALWADAKSGRQARWETLHLIVQALFANGFDVLIRPKSGCLLDVASQKKVLRFAVAHYDRKLQRELMSEIGKKGGRARAKNLNEYRKIAIAKKGGRARAKQLPPEQRSEQARQAAKARWSTPIVEALPKSAPAALAKAGAENASR